MPENPFVIPPAGLQGDHADTCVICLQGTDTGLAFRGDAEWVAAGGVMLGVPTDQATIMVSRALGCEPGMMLPGVLTFTYRVCADCAARAGAMAPCLLVQGGEVPCYHQPS
jgi:hypothetical protein